MVNFKKAEFVSAVAEKTGMTKAESEVALSAVLNVIATVSAECCVSVMTCGESERWVMDGVPSRWVMGVLVVDG